MQTPPKSFRLLAGDALLLVHPQVDFMPGGQLAVPLADEILPFLQVYRNF